MNLPMTLRTVTVAASLVMGFSSCKNYSTATTKRLEYSSPTRAGRIIHEQIKHPAAGALAQAGQYLDAADAARVALKAQPGDTQAMADYNFAVGRLFEVIYDAGLEPWKAPLHCPGANGEWLYSLKTEKRPERNAANFRITPADRIELKGSLVKQRTIKAGLGAPLVVNSKGIDPTKLDRFAQGKTLYYGMTGLVDFNGRRCEGRVADPLADESITFDGRSYPVAADFTAPIGLALAELKPRKLELQRMFKPEQFKATMRLARLQPYDPKKIPLLVIHGLGDSQATWAPMIETLRGDAFFRQHYQVWFYSYPTGYPYPLPASVLREDLAAINARYPDHKPIVVIGHSMGGMIARTLMTDSGMAIWNAYFDTPPAQTPLSPEARSILTKALIFKHQPRIARVIYMSASLRGSETATGFMGKLGAKLVGSPSDLSEVGKEFAKLAKPAADGKQIKGAPNSIQGLDPNNRFLTTIDKIPLVKGIPFHSVIGDRGKGGNLDHTKPQSTDGIVPYWSSHLDGAQSERIVPSNHWSNQDPQGIAEVRRILLAHVGKR